MTFFLCENDISTWNFAFIVSESGISFWNSVFWVSGNGFSSWDFGWEWMKVVFGIKIVGLRWWRVLYEWIRGTRKYPTKTAYVFRYYHIVPKSAIKYRNQNSVNSHPVTAQLNRLMMLVTAMMKHKVANINNPTNLMLLDWAFFRPI